MLKKLLVLTLLFYVNITLAETIKTEVLVIGDSPGGVTAAIQCARSKVKTLLIMQGNWLQNAMPVGKSYAITANLNLPTGIWGEFCDHVKSFYKSTTGYAAAPGVTLKFEGATGAEILKGMADSVKNLTIRINTPFTNIVKDGTGWDVTMTVNGQSNVIKAKLVIDATEKGDLISKAGATLPRQYKYTANDNDKIYRTSIATSDVVKMGYIPMQDVVVRDADNLLVTDQILLIDGNAQYLPLQMALGQGVGAMAAYAVFFKTTTKNLKVRLIQQEMLDFKAYLLPFADIKRDDRYIRAIQQVGATGMLKGIVQTNGELFFKADETVNTGEVKPVLNEIYTRAFLWFNKEKPGEKFTIGNTLSLISEMTLSDPETLQISIKSDWVTKYHFNSPFDLARPITRLEFAALINKYLNPFARTVDLSGNIVN